MALWKVTQTQTEWIGQIHSYYRPYGYRGAIIVPGRTNVANTAGAYGSMHYNTDTGLARYGTGRTIGDTTAPGPFYLIYDHPDDAAILQDGPTNITSWHVYLGTATSPSPTSVGEWRHVVGSGFTASRIPLDCKPDQESVHVYLNTVLQRQNVDWKLVEADGKWHVESTASMDTRGNDLLEARYVCKTSA